VLNADGTIAVGKYTLDENQKLAGSVGWLPWVTGNGSVNWLSALEDEVFFTSIYSPPGIASLAKVVEQLDQNYFLDAGMLVNLAPPAMAPPVGKGPMWWMPGASVDLVDFSTLRPQGTYQIDANGFIIPQFTGGEDLTLNGLIAGQTWTATYEPFIPQASPGPDSQQRMRRRKIVKAVVSVLNCSGFSFGARRIPAYFVGDDSTKAPPLPSTSFQFRSRGRSFDPRVQLVKDTPGPLIITEIGLEVTV
jgi:hypothetical protein